MSNAIHRVISEGDNVAMSDPQMYEEAAVDGNLASPQQSQQPVAASAAVVEPDHIGMDVDTDETQNNNNAPIGSIESGNSETFTTSSSLSETSANGGDQDFIMHDEDEEKAQLKRMSGSDLQMGMDYANQNNADNSSSSDVSSLKASSQHSSREWGFYIDIHESEHFAKQEGRPSNEKSKKGSKKEGTLVPQVSSGEVQEFVHFTKDSDPSAMAVTAPTYVLEESLSSQRLWKFTAGQRPPQPVEERAFFEKMWAQNFARSQVQYGLPVEVLTATSPVSLSPFADGQFEGGPTVNQDVSTYSYAASNMGGSSAGGTDTEAALVSRMNESGDNPNHPMLINKEVKGSGSDGNLTILIKGDNVFGTTVSKSFARPSEDGGTGRVVAVNISIASYRVVESRKHGKYAQFLVIYREGSILDTIGIWKRSRDFEELAKKITQAHEGCATVIGSMSPLAVTEEPETEHLPNAITSWRLLKKRQRWYRCLDAGYLSLKVFLLERFLHDILFESSNPNLLRDFVGADTTLSS